MPHYKMTPGVPIILASLLCYSSSYGQTNLKQMYKIVLDNAIIDSTYIFGNWTKGGETETHLKYLGDVSSTTGHKYRLVNYVWFWGLSKRTTSRLLIFFYTEDSLAGYYQFTMPSDLPDRLERNKIIFSNKDNPECDTSITTVVQIESGFPMKLFIKCTADNGDFYQYNDPR